MERKRWVLFVIVNLITCSLIFAGSIVKEFEFPVSVLKFDYIDNYSLVSLKGCDLLLQETGQPIIPFANLNVLIPPSSEITNIEILESKRTEIAGEYFLCPAQPPRPISFEGEIPFVSPDEATYQLATEYPQKIDEIIPSGNKSEFRIGGVFLYPLQYIPKERKLILYEKLKIKINYEENRYEVGSLTQSQKQLFKTEIKDLVINPENIEAFSPQVKVTDNPDIDYIILTSTTLEPRFASLVNWLKKTGFLTETRTTSWVSTNYTGRDLQEKIRNFVRDYFTNHGLKYILLAGDHSIIPSRQARAVVGSDVGDIPSDLYYLDLQWSWDGNNNNIFGETTYDTVDFYYDLYGGRWSFETTAEVDTMIRKFMTYVKNPDTLYQKRLLLPAALLWTGYTHMQSQDSIANLSPTGWTDREIDMGSNDAWRNAVRDSLNTGFGFAHLVGHGNDYGVYISGPMYYYTDPATQTNYNKLAIVNSIACIPGNFETEDCLAEEMMKARGCAIAVMMNSRYGWGTPPSMGPSEALDLRFFHYLFSRDSIRIANCHQGSKQAYRNSALSDQVWRWCYYELNLFGEPQMMMWKDNPKKMIATFPNTINTGSQSFTVTVTSQDSPLQSANVFLWKGTEVYLNGLSNASGQAIFSINPTTNGYIYVTVVAKNKIPFEDSSQVSNSSRDVGVELISNPGNTIPKNTAMIPRALVKNYGTSTQSSIPVACSIVGSGGTLRYTNTQTITTLAAGDTFRVSFSSWTPVIAELCTVKIRTSLSGDENPGNDRKTRTSEVLLLNNVGVEAIIFPLATHNVNSSMVPIAKVKNFGFTAQTSFPVVCSIVSSSGVLRYTNTQTITSLASLDTVRVNFSSWTPVFAELCTVKMRTGLSGDEQLSDDRKIQTTTMIQVYFENFEASNGSYSPNPTTGAWEWGIPTSGPNAAHSGTKLWATILAGNYTNNADWKLTSKEFAANQNNPTLKFWHWYNMEESGTFPGRAYDGGNVKISTDSGNTWTVVRPVGGYDGVGYSGIGGIVGESCYTGINESWNEAAFILPVSNAQRFFLRWHFGSDAAVLRSGWYIDDVSGYGFDVYDMVEIKDVGVDAIIYPTGTHQVNTTLQPIARIKNYGNRTQTSFPVVCSIVGSGGAFRYTNTQYIASLSASDTMRVSFTTWTPTILEPCTVKIRTNLSGDQSPANDRRTNPFTVVDFTPPAIPSLVLPTNGFVTNNQTPQFIWRSVTDGDTYNLVVNTGKSVIDIRTHDTTYTPSTNLTEGYYLWKIRAKDAAGNWSNFSGEWAFTIDITAPAIPGLISPANASIINNTTTQLVWHSVSDAVLYNLVVNSGKSEIVNEMLSDTTFTPDEFAEGNYAWKIRAQDAVGNWSNFSTEWTFTIASSGPAAPNLVSPNNGANINDLTPEFIWHSAADADTYNLTVELEKQIIEINTDDTTYTPVSNLSEGTYLWKVRAKNSLGNWGFFSNQWSFTIITTTPGWMHKDPMPTRITGKYVKDGGAIVSAGGNLYAFRGNKSWEFYRYDEGSRGTWTQIDSIPYGVKPTAPTTINKKKVGKGAALCYDGDNTIYATKGNSTKEFWAYSILDNNWTAKAFVPVPKHLKGGTSIVFDNGKVYLLAGGQKTTDPTNFYVYETSNNTWSSKTKATLFEGKAYKDGSSITFLGGKIYALQGGGKHNYFARFDDLIWTQLETIPQQYPTNIVSNPKKNKVKDGGAMTTDGSVIYAIKGGGKNEFWKYTPGSPGVWTGLDTIPSLNKKSVPKTGAALTFASGRVYLLKGNNTTEFLQFTPPGQQNSIQVASLTNISLMTDKTLTTSAFHIEIMPNPFTKRSAIHLTIPISGKTTLKLYNINGTLVKTVHDGYLNAGDYSINLSVKNLAKGIYFLRYDDMTNQSEIKLIMQ